MKELFKGLLWITGGIIVYTQVNRYIKNLARKFSAEFKGVKFRNRDGLKFYFDIALKVVNRNDFGVPNVVFRGGIQFRDKPLAPIHTGQVVNIKPQSSQLVNLTLVLDEHLIMNLVNIVPDIRKGFALGDLKLVGDVLMINEKNEVLIGTSLNESLNLDLNMLRLW